RAGRDLGHDLVAVEIAGHSLVGGVLRGAVVLPRPASGIPQIAAAHASRVNHRQALVVGLVDQGADVGKRHPGILTPAVAPPLDGFQDRLWLVAAERIIDIDDDERGPLAEALAGTITRGREYRLIAFGEELVPDRFGHGLLLGLTGLRVPRAHP